MSNKIEIEGSTVEEAIQQALNALGASRDKVEIDILHHPRKGILGIGARRAKVRATLREGVKVDGEEFEISSRGRDGRNNRRRGRRSDEGERSGSGERSNGRGRRSSGGGRNDGRGTAKAADSKEDSGSRRTRAARPTEGQGARAEDGNTRNRQQGQKDTTGGGGGSDRRQGRGEQADSREQGESTGRGRRRGGRGRGRDRDRRDQAESSTAGVETKADSSAAPNSGPTAGTEERTEPRGRNRRGRGRGRGDGNRAQDGAASEGAAEASEETQTRASQAETQATQQASSSEQTPAQTPGTAPTSFAETVSPEVAEREPEPTVPAEPVDLVELAGRSGELTKELFSLMGFGAEVETRVDDEEGEVVVGVRADAEGLLIGRRGQTLDALEHILNRMSLRADVAGDAHVLLDIGEYRQRRRESLAELASRLKERALSEGRNVQVSPMSPRDRKFFQQALEGEENVETRSLGAGFYRRVVVVPSVEATKAAAAAAPASDQANEESGDNAAGTTEGSTELRDPS